MRCILSGEIVPILNDEILNEYSLVLGRKKFGFPDLLIETILNSICQLGVSSERIISGVDLPDPKDLVFYEVTLSVEDSFLVTGNTKHFPKEPFVVTPAELIHIIDSIENSKSGLLSDPSKLYKSKISFDK